MKLRYLKPGTPEEVKMQFKALAKKLHPDLGGSEEEMKVLNAEYKFLSESKGSVGDGGLASSSFTGQQSDEVIFDFVGFAFYYMNAVMSASNKRRSVKITEPKKRKRRTR